MYVCLCTPTTDEEIIDCCKDGCTLEELKINLDICQNCKCCSDEVTKLYNQNSVCPN